MRAGDLQVRIGPLPGFKAFAMSLAKAQRRLHQHRMCSRRPGVVLPIWEWWEIRKHIRADWRRYKLARKAYRERRHYDWVNYR